MFENMPSIRIMEIEVELAPYSSNPFANNSKTRDLVISLLASSLPLSCRQITNIIQRMRNQPISFQAVHKLVKQLIEEKILLKENNKYLLNPGWVTTVKSFFSEYEKKMAKLPLLVANTRGG